MMQAMASKPPKPAKPPKKQPACELCPHPAMFRVAQVDEKDTTLRSHVVCGLHLNGVVRLLLKASDYEVSVGLAPGAVL